MTPPPAPARARHALLLLWVAGLGACGNEPSPLPPPNAPPLLRIQHPLGDAAVRQGEAVELEATVEDAEDGATLGERVLWVSSVSGQLALGARASGTFREAGDHTVTATVVDSGGQSTSASVTVRVLAENAPHVMVRRPAPGARFNLDESLDLECEALAVDGRRLTGGAVRWSSALSGPLPSGDVVKAALVVAGEDTLTCSAIDPETGGSGAATVAVTVRPLRAPAERMACPEDTGCEPGSAGD